ncbi:DUF72 domain-containing protein [Candidatus Bathyarchaeota archaeon]|nr:DUF72 domain-containing protein [Candidatus Bathyarchaeota archaeon]
MSLRIGTSGWYYDEWVGPFYDRKKGMFTAYTKVFDTAEVNSTFYAYPRPQTVEGWERNSPDGFTFALKLPKVITHDKWLDLGEGVEGDTGRFLNLLLPLYRTGKLGPILIQLRPKFNYEEHVGNLESYLEVLPSEYEWAVEFRHKSWMRPETYEILRKHNAAYTIVDESLLPPSIHVTADFAYVRWHGHGSRIWYDYDYSASELDSWVLRVNETTRRAKKVYGYFNNHYSANAVKNAVELLEMLDAATAEQSSSLRKIVEHRAQKGRPRGVQPLEAFKVDDADVSVADHLMRFTDAPRLSRGEKIDDSELTITLSSEDRIQAEIRSYVVDIDLERRTLRHDCDDWRKGVDRKRLCKHLAKLFLELPPGQAKQILGDMWENRESWRFEAI